MTGRRRRGVDRALRRAAKGALVVAVLLAACTTGAEEVDEEEPEDAESADLTEPPEIAPLLPDPEASPPEELQVEDLVVGEGEQARTGMVATVQYVGIAWSTGEPFDASWDRRQPFSFELGAGRVIEGWELGVQGMRVGGRRVLVIPPELGYGARGVPGTIAADETLIFVVDLLDVAAPS